MLENKITGYAKRWDLFFEAIQRFRNTSFLPGPLQNIWRYLSAFVFIGLAVELNHRYSVFQHTPTMLLFAGVIITSWYAGLGPGLLAAPLAVLALDYYFIQPIGSVTIGIEYIPRSMVFGAVAVLISSLVESQRRAEVKIRALIEEQKRFNADASHELFTPLAVIKTQSEVLMQNPDSTILDYRKLVSSNLEEIDYMSSIVEDLLELSRSERQETVKKERIELQEVVQIVVQKIKALVDKKKINLVIQRSDHGYVLADKSALIHMIINLIQNAVQYTDEEGLVVITVIKTAVSMQFTIKDNGIGIAKENLARLFDPFYKANENRSVGGPGLGLSIVKRIADLHSATIQVDSVLKVGTTISVILPAA